MDTKLKVPLLTAHKLCTFFKAHKTYTFFKPGVVQNIILCTSYSDKNFAVHAMACHKRWLLTRLLFCCSSTVLVLPFLFSFKLLCACAQIGVSRIFLLFFCFLGYNYSLTKIHQLWCSFWFERFPLNKKQTLSQPTNLKQWTPLSEHFDFQHLSVVLCMIYHACFSMDKEGKRQTVFFVL